MRIRDRRLTANLRLNISVTVAEKSRRGLMRNSISTLICAAALLAACNEATPPSEAPDIGFAEDISVSAEAAEAGAGDGAKYVAQIFWISAQESDRIPVRVLDAVNGLRMAKELPGVSLSRALNAAARTHALDMAVQNRPWHFGSDGSSPVNRAEMAGYQGWLLGENISESFESDLATLTAWMDNPETRALILDPQAREIGIGWHQEATGKIWWTFVAGT